MRRLARRYDTRIECPISRKLIMEFRIQQRLEERTIRRRRGPGPGREKEEVDVKGP